MTIAFDPHSGLRHTTESTAANDDHVGHTASLIHNRADKIAGATGGWDAYEVWRRLIKEARERRAGTAFPK
jgi:hypothetical protein